MVEVRDEEGLAVDSDCDFGSAVVAGWVLRKRYCCRESARMTSVIDPDWEQMMTVGALSVLRVRLDRCV